MVGRCGRGLRSRALAPVDGNDATDPQPYDIRGGRLPDGAGGDRDVRVTGWAEGERRVPPGLRCQGRSKTGPGGRPVGHSARRPGSPAGVMRWPS
jgi:hypothetical protein